MNPVHTVVGVILLSSLGLPDPGRVSAAQQGAQGQTKANSLKRPDGEGHLQYVRRLRYSGKFEPALAYLKKLSQFERLSKDIKGQIPFEQGLTLSTWAKQTKEAEKRSEREASAINRLTTFLKAEPKHERAAEAFQTRGMILIRQAEADLNNVETAKTDAQKVKLRTLARKKITAARSDFQSAVERYQRLWSSFPKYIPPEDREQLKQRQTATVSMIVAELEKAKTHYWEARSYSSGSAEFKKEMNHAADEFGKIHTRYRSQVGGLYAQLWIGRCCEELGLVKKALGIYGELLSHPARSQAMKNLQHVALSFKLICLNHPQRRDHILVQQLAQKWLKENVPYHRTLTGLGIRYELARAQEEIARAAKTSDEDRDAYLKRALENARFVARYPGRFRPAARLMVDRLESEPGKDGKPPADFDEAYSRAKAAYLNLRDARNRLDAAKRENDRSEITRCRRKYESQQKEAVEICRVAIKLETKSTDLTRRMRVRYLLSYFEYDRKNHAVAYQLGMTVARTMFEIDEQTSRDGAYLAMAAASAAFKDADGDAKAVARKRVTESAEFLIKYWPDSSQAKFARMTLESVKKSNH